MRDAFTSGQCAQLRDRLAKIAWHRFGIPPGEADGLAAQALAGWPDRPARGEALCPLVRAFNEACRTHVARNGAWATAPGVETAGREPGAEREAPDAGLGASRLSPFPAAPAPGALQALVRRPDGRTVLTALSERSPAPRDVAALAAAGGRDRLAVLRQLPSGRRARERQPFLSQLRELVKGRNLAP